MTQDTWLYLFSVEETREDDWGNDDEYDEDECDEDDEENPENWCDYPLHLTSDSQAFVPQCSHGWETQECPEEDCADRNAYLEEMAIALRDYEEALYNIPVPNEP